MFTFPSATISGAMTLTCYNVAGLGINPGITYGLYRNDVTLSVKAPALFGPYYCGFGVRADTKPEGANYLNFTEKTGYARIWTVAAPGLEPGLELSYSAFDSSDNVTDGGWIFGKAFTQYISADKNWYAEWLAGGSNSRSFNRQTLKALYAHGIFDIPVLKVSAKGMFSLLQGTAPEHLKPALGGVEFLRGYSSRSVIGDQVAAASIDLIYQLPIDIFNARAFVDCGYVSGNAAFQADAGISFNIDSPGGLMTFFYATPLNQWKPRFGMSVGSLF
jgi:hypothetical protein